MGRNIHLYAAGSNAQGQLGTTNCDDAHTFSPCAFAGSPPGELPPGTESIVHVAGGGNHTLALLSRRASPDSPPRTELWGCGDGSKGQLGPYLVSPRSLIGRIPVLDINCTVSYPAIHPHPSTAFQCYARKKTKTTAQKEGNKVEKEEVLGPKDILVVGEGEDIEFISNGDESQAVADAGCR